MKTNLNLENELKKQGFKYVVGVDEVGRGSLCGPVVASAVYIPDDFNIIGIKDSKKLSKKNREKLYKEITTYCPYSIGMVSEKKIDEINIKQATMLAMKLAISDIESADFALIDGSNIPSGLNICAKAITRGDTISASIASASIVSKVFRDNLMRMLHDFYPMYGWNTNVGYGTFKHRSAIIHYGPCEYHRKTFKGVREFIGD